MAEGLQWTEFLITVVGFPIGVWQLVRTKQAARAARDAANRTERQLASQQLLTLLPQLQSLEMELDLAALHDDHRGTLRVLHQWRQGAVQLQTLLVRLEASRTLRAKIQDSNALAATAKGLLLDETPDVVAATTRVREAVSDVCATVIPAAADLAQRKAKEEDR